MHDSPGSFAEQLRLVWQGAAKISKQGAKLVCRFGSIRDRPQDPVELIKRSLDGSGWRIITIRDAGTAHNGKRQAAQFGQRITCGPRRECDVYAERD